MNCYGYLEGVNGIKTGFTNGAGRCLVTSVSRDNFNIITVVLGADTKKMRTRDSIKLIEYTYKNYELVDIEKAVTDEFKEWLNLNKKRIIVEKAEDNKIDVAVGNVAFEKYPIKKENKNLVYIDAKAKYNWKAPLAKNTTIGEISIYIDNTKIDEVEIKLENDIAKKNITKYMCELLSFYSSL